MIESPNPQICSQTHSFESIFILTVLVLKVIDLGLEVLDLLVYLEDGLLGILGIWLVVVGELREHHVASVDSTLRHPLALENLLLHYFEPRLHASGPFWSLFIARGPSIMFHISINLWIC